MVFESWGPKRPHKVVLGEECATEGKSRRQGAVTPGSREKLISGHFNLFSFIYWGLGDTHTCASESMGEVREQTVGVSSSLLTVE